MNTYNTRKLIRSQIKSLVTSAFVDGNVFSDALVDASGLVENKFVVIRIESGESINEGLVRTIQADLSITLYLPDEALTESLDSADDQLERLEGTVRGAVESEPAALFDIVNSIEFESFNYLPRNESGTAQLVLQFSVAWPDKIFTP